MPPSTPPPGLVSSGCLVRAVLSQAEPLGLRDESFCPAGWEQGGPRLPQVCEEEEGEQGKGVGSAPSAGERGGCEPTASPPCLSPLPSACGGVPKGIRGTPVPGFPWLSGVGLAGFGLPGEAAALRIPEEEADAHQGADPGVRPRRPRQRRLLLSLRTGRHPRRGTVTPGVGGGDGHPRGWVLGRGWRCCRGPPRHGAHPGTESKPTAAGLGVLRVLRALGGASWPPGVPRELSVPAWEPVPGCAPTSPRVNWGATPPQTPQGAAGAAAEVVRTTFNKTVMVLFFWGGS